MSYAIMRIQKIKTKQALAEREKHNIRTKTVFSADGSKNILVEGHRGLVKRLKELEKEVEKNNGRKTRKDAVKAIEVLFTSDKAFFNRVDAEQYFTECKKWLEKTFETEKLYQYSLHLDEEVAHLHCIISTLHDGKFNYSYYADNRKKLRALQDSFYKAVEHFGLKRGIKAEVTGATYQSNKEWNKSIMKARGFSEALNEENRLNYAIKGVLETEKERNLERKVIALENNNIELYKDFTALKRINKKLLTDIECDSKKEEYIKNIIKQERSYMEEEKKAIDLEPPTIEEIGF